MAEEIRIFSTVGSDGRIEISAPGLPEGLSVEIVLYFDTHQKTSPQGILDYFYSLPAGPHSASSWQAFEQAFETERNGWN